jgi:hypothetical protein
MTWPELRAFWAEFPRPFRIIVSHTTWCALADLSFIALFRFAHQGAITGWPLIILDKTEQIVLVAVTLYFALVTIYDLTEERARAIIRFFASRHSVLA